MQQYRKLAEDLYWVGGNDRRLALFESAFPIPRGISYNAYLVLDQKTVLLDTVDKAVGRVFFESLQGLLGDRPLDYVVVNHMEPDHCATLEELVIRYPGVQIVGNKKTLEMIRQFFDFETEGRFQTVGEGDTLTTGRHTFTFYMAPMVHWPEVMVTYDNTSETLYSADAFGSFGAIDGNLFADQVRFEEDWLAEARRYYTNIVGKYGVSVRNLLKKLEGLPIKMLCPLHGLVWRENIDWYVDKHQKWAAYEPEERGVCIAYASVYGDTQNAAEIFAAALADRGVQNIAMYDVAVTHPSVILAEAFRRSHLVFAATTYNAGIFPAMETLLLDLKSHNLQNRTVAVIENGSWAPTAGSLMRGLVSEMKGMRLLGDTVSIRSSVKPEQVKALEALAEQVAADLNGTPATTAPAPKKRKWRCKVCGYVYEGDPLPADFICPWCKQPASSFEPFEE